MKRLDKTAAIRRGGTLKKVAGQEILDRIRRCRSAITAILEDSQMPSSRAYALTVMLRALWPSVPLYGCELVSEGGLDLCVIDEAGLPRPQWGVSVQAVLTAADPGEGTSIAPLPPELELPAHVLAVEKILFRGQSFGMLALAIPEVGPPLMQSGVRALLTACAGQIAACFYAESAAKEAKSLRQELDEQTRLAHLGELAGPVAHESNNFLNVVLLQIAVMELEVPASLQAQLEVIRRQAAEFQGLVQQFQSQRRQLQPAPQLVDLNRVVRESLPALGRPSSALVVSLAPDLPPVWGSTADFKRLLTLLLTRARDGGGDLTIRTEKAPPKVVLRLQGVLASRLKSEALEWAACQAIVRRLQGRIFEGSGEETSPGLVVEFKEGPNG